MARHRKSDRHGVYPGAVEFRNRLTHAVGMTLGLIANFVIDLCAPICLEFKVVRKITLKGEIK